ncbi:hypothetical protein C8J57DRAFT_1538606 [Mycena rebaudengoi]|nr:hypothetical protein C8J57DRAFT_1538606 [Mycena rebaudengoi]
MSSDWASTAGEDRPEDKNMPLGKKMEDVLRRHPMDDHFKMPPRKGLFGWLQWSAFILICWTAYGDLGMEPLWVAFKLDEEGDESAWTEMVRILVGRLNNLVLLGSLLLATSSVFITIVNYTLRWPYIFILSAFGFLIGGVIHGAAGSAAVSQAWPYWAEKVCYRNRFYVYGTTMAIAGPTFSIATAAILLAFGMLNAVWWAKDRGMKALTVALLFILISTLLYMTVGFITAGPALFRLRRGTPEASIASQRTSTSTELQPLSAPHASPTPDNNPLP